MSLPPSSSSSSSPFSLFLASRYTVIKSAHPADGRRRCRLRVAKEFWEMGSEKRKEVLENLKLSGQEDASALLDTILNDPDEFDTSAGSGLGIVVRTDYTNEDAWQEFCSKLREEEKQFVLDVAVVDEDRADVAMDEKGEDEDDDDDEEGQEEEDKEEENDKMETNMDTSDTPPIFTLFSAPASIQPLFTNLSNIAVLRLFNDVSIDHAPTPPPGVRRISSPNALIDMDGFQESYTGKLIWVYDSRSNMDQSVRVVSQRGSGYGTATGDSWRARVSFLPELQVNLSSGAMTIDFGGLDRWDFNERQRNLTEAEIAIS